MSSEATDRKTVFFNSDGSYDRTREAEGPRVSVKAVRDGEVGGKAVKKGQTVTLCERDAIREMCWNSPPVIEVDVFKLTRMGSIFLRSRGHDYYEEPVGAKGVIPKIKVVGTEDNAMVGCYILMKGEVREVPEDVAWGLLRSPCGSRFHIDPEAEFTLPPATLNAMIASGTFDVYHRS